jgi:hypothetical protein
MAENFGPGVSRVLDPTAASLVQVVWQQGKPPLDSELNLAQQIASEWNRLHVLRGTPSGFYGDAINPQDSFVTSPANSNWFKFGPQFPSEKGAIAWAVVNGWLVPVTGTLTGSPPGNPNNADTWNRITLPPPPANTGDARIDFVFLEAWLARVPPNPATTNKPAASAIWRYGNVEGGYSFLPDDLQDTALGFETTQRVQLQYRIRVVSGVVGLAGYPDGFDPSVVKGQGSALSASSFVFENMRKELGDPGLWRAGDGTQNALGTVDGYTYGVPICAVFRRNRVAWSQSNLNGSFDRNPSAVDRTGFKTFSTIPTLVANMDAAQTSLTLTTITNIPLPLTPAAPVTIQIGDEYLTYTAITGTTMTGVVRGVFGSRAETHKAGSVVKIVSGRPDGMFADQIAKTDILDLRHTVNPGGFDYQGLLKNNLDQLLRGQLRSTWKRSGGGPQGPFVQYLDAISATSGSLGVTKLLDSPDGIRTIWGDPAALQPVVIPLETPSAGTNPVAPVGATLGNSFNAVTCNHTGSAGYQIGNVITVPKSLFTVSFPGSDADQVRLVADAAYVKLRFMGETTDLPTGQYSLSNNGGGDLLITFTGSFTPRNAGCFLTLYVQYGAGRGLSRRPAVVHSVNYVSASPNIALQPQAVPANSTPLRAAWFGLWAKNTLFNGSTPSTAEAYVDPGSKTVALTPFRLMTFATTNNQSNLRTIQKGTGALNGAMPSQDLAGNPKWVPGTDPLNLFSGYTDPTGTRANMVVIMPKAIWPSWGEVRAPILYQDNGNIDQGVNYCIAAPKGTVGAGVSNYIPMVNGAATYAVFSTLNLNTSTPATYNAAFTFGVPIAGMRFFTDTLGLNRQGLELPPFYGVARLFAVYSANDYKLHGSAFNPSTREPDPTPGSAVNLLRQNFDGPVFFVTKDADGDSTFVINAEALDLSRSPDAIASFGAGDYVIEASIFGADRGCFDRDQDSRIVLARGRSQGLTAGETLDHPSFILPGAPELGDELTVCYSRSPYQGDAWNSQSAAADTGYKPGALSTSVRYQLLNTVLDYPNLSKPNPKTLEILSSIGFQTTLGTGRFSGDMPDAAMGDVRVTGYEPWTIPSTSVAARPTVTPGALALTERGLSVGSELLGATCHLPLGALFLDKDFRGNAIGGPSGDQRHMMIGDYSPASQAASVAPVDNQEYAMAPVHTASVSTDSGVVVHLDGNGDSYNVLLNYRTNRGGSAFTASGLAGGDLGAVLPSSTAALTSGGILSGVAYLVRNVPTSIGANEVSAGQEVMMLVVTTARTQKPSSQNSQNTHNTVQMGSAGSGEGFSAADVYRISGHPLTNDPARSTVDPLDVVLARKSDTLSSI